MAYTRPEEGAATTSITGATEAVLPAPGSATTNGGRLALQFTGAYTPPPGDAVGLAFANSWPELTYIGLGNQGSVGTPGVRYRYRRITVAGTDYGGFGGVDEISRGGFRVFATGFRGDVVQAPEYVRWPRIVAPPRPRGR
jgi:hypothetical protein